MPETRCQMHHVALHPRDKSNAPQGVLRIDLSLFSSVPDPSHQFVLNQHPANLQGVWQHRDTLAIPKLHSRGEFSLSSIVSSLQESLSDSVTQSVILDQRSWRCH